MKNRINKKNGNTSNIYILIDDDKIWESSNKNIKEIVNEVTESQMIAELTATYMIDSLLSFISFPITIIVGLSVPAILIVFLLVFKVVCKMSITESICSCSSG